MINQNTNGLSPPSVQREYEDPWNKLVIDLDAVRSNYHYIKSKLSGKVIFYAVLKSDAYGHDLIETGKVLVREGCRHFAVDTPQEGIRLRNSGIKGEILIMNPIPAWMAELSVRHDLSISVIHESILQPIEEAARLMDKTSRIHLNVNVGLNRLGIAPSRIRRIASKAIACQHIQLEGLFGQPRDSDSAIESFNQISSIYQDLKSKDLAPKHLHFANSTTFLMYPETLADGIRLGIILYGVLPPEQYLSVIKDNGLKPAMSLETEIVQIRDLPAGSRIGYRSKEKTKEDLTIGTIPVGYNHGLDRKALDGGSVLVNGQKSPFIGAISMNSSTIDITGIGNVHIGTEVKIIGKQGNKEIDINELAHKSGTIAAELMIRFGKSIPRDYRIDGKGIISEIVLQQDKMDDIHIQYFQTENELPGWLNVHVLVNFLHSNMIPYEDPLADISKAVDYALSTYPEGKGFVLLATTKRKIIGMLVSIIFDKVDVKPGNLIAYLCVHKDFRENGLGSRLISEAIDCSDGDLRILIRKENPAVTMFRKLGFSDDYIELCNKKTN